MYISVIVTTYNWPKALKLVLEALSHQDASRFEVVIADDGSTAETRRMIGQFMQNAAIPITHVWHEDTGFRAAKITNKAVAAAKKVIIYFLSIMTVCLPGALFLFIINYRVVAILPVALGCCSMRVSQIQLLSMA